ncbi:MAG: peptidoglycan hydrolase-like protein with peptidoglycan-binding domain [Ilumatobacter sp.]|jgi:peptidoglycan hydrolase-like protein with peptidoglycan-binding domain
MMTKQVSPRNRIRRVFLQGACGALVASGGLSAMPAVASAAPQPANAPLVAQGLVGLRLGSVGADVATVQRALIAAGIPVAGGADGNYGPATRAAVVSFQSSKGLAQSGEIDTATAGALGVSTPATPATPATSVAAYNGLQVGATGPAVTELQKRLLATGLYFAGGADGRYGKSTAVAVSYFQGWNGLTRSGVVDAATALKLGITSGSAPVAPPATVAPSAVNEFVGLKSGARGPLVKELQEKLIASGTAVRGGADGDFGNATKSALIAFQRLNSLPDTGVVSQQEADLLKLGTPAAAAVTTTPSVVAPATASEPAVATPSNPYVGLAVGARGPLVKDLQQKLIDAGMVVSGGPDGVFGNATKLAVTKFQQANGLGVSGAIYAATANMLGLGTTPPPVAEPTAPPVAPAAANPYVGLTLGNQGPLVKDLQTALIGTGLVVRGGADGSFGNATKSALISFQSVNAIPQTGVVTEQGAQILNLGTKATPVAEPSSFAPTPDGFPKKGESSERVRAFQQLLIDSGINLVGGADGSFGNATASAIAKFQQTNGLTVTGTVTQETADQLGLAGSDTSPPPTAATVTLDRFPIQGQCYYGNTWHAPRGNGRLHEGVDVIAGEGNLLYSVVDGTVTKQYWDQPGALAGNGIRVAQDDGTYFTYLHMSGFAPGIEIGTKVKAGDVIGFVGNTGSSATPHLHFEIHPDGGAAVNPYPYLKAIDDCGNTTPQYQSSFAPAE